MPISRGGPSESKASSDSHSDTQSPLNQQSQDSTSSWKSSPQDDPKNYAASLAQTAAQLRTRYLLSNPNKRLLKKYRTELSASTASLFSTLSAYPLDSVKTRMQAYNFSSFHGCVKHTYAAEGVHGFWRGVLAPLASITLVRTVSFSIYQKTKYAYDSMITRSTGRSPLEHANTRGAWPSLGTMLCFGGAGATSGALITLISCPFELTKLNAQIAVLLERGVDESKPDKGKGRKATKTMGTMETVRGIVRQRGFLGLYSGFHLHLLRDTIGTAIYFTTYESAKQLLANARGNSPTSPFAVVIAGGLCGLVSWACIYPIDSAKSVYQRIVLGEKAAGEGGGGGKGVTEGKRPKIEFFSRKRYRGLGVSMGRSCLVNAIFFSVFEGVKKGVNGLEVEEEGED